MSRAEHLNWAKQRALKYVDAGELINAVVSMGSDLSKHSELGIDPFLMRAGMLSVEQGDSAGVRRWIEGFN